MKNSESYELYMDSWNKKNPNLSYLLYVKCISEFSEKQTNKQTKKSRNEKESLYKNCLLLSIPKLFR